MWYFVEYCTESSATVTCRICHVALIKGAVYIYESHRIGCIRIYVLLVGQLAGVMRTEGGVTVVSLRSQHQPSGKKHVAQTPSSIMPITLCFTGNVFPHWKCITTLLMFFAMTFTECNEEIL